MYPWTGLPIKSVLVGTHVCCLLRDRRRAALFLSCTGRLRPSSCVSGKTLVFHLRYVFQVLHIRSQCLDPGNYPAFNLIQGSIITLTHSDEPYMQKYMGDSWKPRFHELGHESKKRLLKTHSHTSERQGNEGGKVRKQKWKEDLALRDRKKSSTSSKTPADDATC